MGERVKELRQRRGMTAEQLAEKCASFGAPQISAAVLANIETGRRDKATGERRRDVTIEEILIFAWALDVPPVLLFLPLDGRTSLQITPDVEAPSLEAFAWATGEQGPADPHAKGRWRDTIGPLELHRDLWRLIEWASRDEFRGDHDTLEQNLRKLGRYLDRMIESDITPPELPPKWAESIRARGWTKYPDEVR